MKITPTKYETRTSIMRGIMDANTLSVLKCKHLNGWVGS
jgi:hypothetical protein